MNNIRLCADHRNYFKQYSLNCFHISNVSIKLQVWGISIITNIIKILTSRGHDDVIKLKHFPRNWPFCAGNSSVSVNSPHKGQWRGALMFTLICPRINGWANNGDAGDLRCHLACYDVIVMVLTGNVRRPLSSTGKNFNTRLTHLYALPMEMRCSDSRMTKRRKSRI